MDIEKTKSKLKVVVIFKNITIGLLWLLVALTLLVMYTWFGYFYQFFFEGPILVTVGILLVSLTYLSRLENKLGITLGENRKSNYVSKWTSVAVLVGMMVVFYILLVIKTQQ